MDNEETTNVQQIIAEDNSAIDDEFTMNLNVLDGNDSAANSTDSDEHVETQPRKRRKRKPKRGVLGADYRDIEEKRLENILFGEIADQFIDDPLPIVETESQRVIADVEENDVDLIPTDLLGNDLANPRKPAWVDEDDEVTK